MYDVTVVSNFKKTDASKQIAYGLVYAPNVLDSANDFTTAAEIERAAHRFLANGFTKNLDIQHDGKESGAFVVESYIAGRNDPHFPEGGWVIGAKCPPMVWTDILSKRLNGFSMMGHGERVAKKFDGKDAHEIKNLSVSAVSFVDRPANRTQFAVLKEDETPAWAKAIAESLAPLAAQIADLERELKASRVAKSRGSRNGFRNVEKPRDDAADVRKAVETERLTKTALETRALERRHSAITEKLHRVWEAGGPRAALVEQNLLAELEKCELELSAIRGTVDVFDVDGAGRSAFHQRGGTSSRGVAARTLPGGDSYFAPKKDAAIRKNREDSIDLGSLKI